MSALLTSIDDIKRSGRISADDVRRLRGLLYPDGGIDRDEAQALIALDEAVDAVDPAWPDLLTEAFGDHVIEQSVPRGYVSDEVADWLVALLARDGLLKSQTELDIVVRVLEKAQVCPPKLVRFALDQVVAAVLDGAGPLAHGGVLTPGVISADEVALLRRILFAAGGDGNVAITRSEADVLFNLNDRTRDAANDPAWNDLFVKGIANYLMAAGGYVPPPREVALARSAWLDQPAGGLGDFFGRMLSGGLGVFARDKSTDSFNEAMATRNAERAEAEGVAQRITDEEAAWLAARIDRDGVIGSNEAALLRLVAKEAGGLHPTLAALAARAA